MRRRLPLRHETDIRKYLGDVRCWVNSGKHLLSLSVSGVDPEQTSDSLHNHRTIRAPYLQI